MVPKQSRGVCFLCVFDDCQTYTLCCHMKGNGEKGASNESMLYNFPVPACGAVNHPWEPVLQTFPYFFRSTICTNVTSLAGRCNFMRAIHGPRFAKGAGVGVVRHQVA